MEETRRRLLGVLGGVGVSAFAGCIRTENEAQVDGGGTTTRETGTATSETSTIESSSSPYEPFSQAANFGADDGDTDDKFGWAIAVSDDGDTAVIGSLKDEDPNGAFAGSAYVFTRTEEGWGQRAKFAPDRAQENGLLGYSVAVDSEGATALIGAPGMDTRDGPGAGAAYCYVRTSDGWQKDATLTATDADGDDRFGWSVALTDDGTSALVGAQFDEDPAGTRAGSAYAYSKTDGGWEEQSKLVPDELPKGGFFGSAIEMTGDGSTALIGASNDGESRDDRPGSVYAYSGKEGSWQRDGKLVPDDDEEGVRLFGDAVALAKDGTTAAVAARKDSQPNGTDAGSVYVFERADDGWRQRSKLVPEDGDEEDLFGQSVAIADDGTTVLVGASRDEDPNGEWAGSTYVFGIDGSGWVQQSKLVPDDGNEEDGFGTAVALTSSGTTALVGADGDEEPNGEYAGSVYVFTR